MNFVLEFEMIGLPKTTNGSHGSWQAAAAERRKWRQAVRMVAYMRRPPKALEKARLTLTRCSTTRPDMDNLAISFKGCVDGLRDAKVILDDNDDVVVERKYAWERPGETRGGSASALRR